MSYEAEVLSRMVQVGSARKYEHILRPEFFSTLHREMFNALCTFEKQYGVCMDEPTFVMQFPDFEWSPSNTQIEWLADELKQTYVEEQLRKMWEDIEPTIADNPVVAAKAVLDQFAALQEFTTDVAVSGIDLVAHGTLRAERLAQRRTGEDETVAGCTTGFGLLDEVTHGTQPGEIELYVARPGIGKTLTMLYGGYKAWHDQGKRISIVSPEMNAYEMGMRLDAFHLHRSQMRMLSGRMTQDEVDDYSDDIQRWRKSIGHDIFFHDAETLGRVFTVGDLRRIVERDRCDLLLLDGLLLTEPVKEAKDVRQRLINLMSELKSFVTETQVAFRAAHQSNREPDNYSRRVTNKKTIITPFDMLPYLHHLAESGATEQLANRVITLAYNEGRMWFAVRKNRNGPKDRIFSVQFNIDLGEISNPKIEDPDAKVEPKQQEFALPTDAELDENVPF